MTKQRQEGGPVPTEATEAARTAWDQIATGYDRHVTPTHLDLSRQALERVGIEQGSLLLDVAAGSGSLAVTAARMGARVTAVDLSPAMVERLRERVDTEGIEDLEALVMDGHALELEDDTFDVAASQFGVMLFPDLPRGLREMVRVTRPGGKVMLAVYGPPQEVEFLSFFMRAVRSVLPDLSPPPLDAPGGPFQAADQAVLRTRFEEAGLAGVGIGTLTEELRFRDGAGLWDWLMNSNPVPGMLLKDTTPAQRKEIQSVISGMVEERAGQDGIAVLRNPVHVAIGHKTGGAGGRA